MKKTVKVGLGTCGISAGGTAVYDALKQEVIKHSLDIEVKETGCIGMCYKEVLVEVEDGDKRYLYATVTPEKVQKIVQEHIVSNKPIHEWLLTDEMNNFLKKQKRIVLRNCGLIDPNSIEEYKDHDGYKALEKCLKEYSPQQVIDIVTQSGLRGRGGAGFSTGTKWKFAAQSVGDIKYVICNADEGDPGAFMDRSVLESDPHSVIEGMIIAAYAIGACEGYFYVRAEYPLAIARLQSALQQCEQANLLGKNILGTSFHFEVHIKEGAGAFVCGEETALMASIEGKRGVPRLRPPFPAVKGLWQKPTNINNVETLANVPWIILNNAHAFNSFGTEKSKGSKVFALAGKIARSGLAEVPMGISIKDIVYEVGGGIADNKKFKAVQIGGPSGGCIPAHMADLQIDYDQISQTGAIMGSGGLIVLDETTCMVDLAKFFLTFTQNESCGKCTFCRLGTKRMLEILDRITTGHGHKEDIEQLEDLASKIKQSSLCGLGQSAPNPVLTTLRYFRDEYEAHIHDKKCPAHCCGSLLEYSINAQKCTGCSLCKIKCPSKAISGEKGKPFSVSMQSCVKCGVCFDVCTHAAVEKI